MGNGRGKIAVEVNDPNPCLHIYQITPGNLCTCGEKYTWCRDCRKILCHTFGPETTKDRVPLDTLMKDVEHAGYTTDELLEYLANKYTFSFAQTHRRKIPYSTYKLAQKDLSVQELMDLLTEKGVQVTESLLSETTDFNPNIPTDWDKIHSMGYMADSGVTLVNAVSEHPDMKDDPVNHPSHYTHFPVEIIEICRWLNFDRGNAVKYICRAGLKDRDKDIEDLEKAMWYLKDEIARMKSIKEHV